MLDEFIYKICKTTVKQHVIYLNNMSMNCSRSVIRWLVNPAEGREEWFFLFSICASEQIQTSNLLLSAEQVKTLCKLDTAEIPEPGKLVQTVIGEFRGHSEPDILDTQ